MSHGMNFLSRRRLQLTMVVKHTETGIHLFLVLLPLKCCDMAVFNKTHIP